MVNLAPRLRALRRQHGLSLEQLAQRTGLTKSFLSKLERAASSPSISTVLKLAQAYDIGVAQLVGQHELSDDESVTVVRRADREPLVGRAGADGNRYEAMAGRRRFKMMNPFVIYPPREKETEATAFPHSGEEFLFVVKGNVEVSVAEHTFVLETGDCVYFDAELPHSVLTVGDENAEVLVVACTKDAGG